METQEWVDPNHLKGIQPSSFGCGEQFSNGQVDGQMSEVVTTSMADTSEG